MAEQIPTQSTSSGSEAPRGVTWRAVLLGLAFIAALAFLMPCLQELRSGPDLGLGPVTGASILTLLVVLGPINGLLLWLRRRWSLTRQEILTVYAMVACTAAISTTGFAEILRVMVTASQYFATQENRWDTLIGPHMPVWMQLNDPQAVRALWQRLPDGQPVPWGAWRGPLLAWGTIAFCIYAGSFALLSLVRRDWIESQRLVFPLAQIPLETVGQQGLPGTPLLRLSVFWIGFAIAFSYGLLGLLNAFYPNVPYFTMQWPIGRSFDRNVMPWGVLNRIEFNLGWSSLGLMCLLPVEVSLSLWVFHVWYYVERFVLASLGFTGESGARYAFDPGAFFDYQTGGALVGFGLLALYQSRRGLVAGVKSWWDPRYRRSDPLDLLQPRYALVVFALSLAGLCWIAQAAGAQPSRLLMLMFLYYTTALSLTRVIAAAGTNHVECGPQMRYLLDHGFGTVGARPASFALLNQMDAIFMTEFKVAFMHYAANDMKVLHSSRVRGTSAVLALAAGVVLMLILGPIGRLWTGYHIGIGSLGAWIGDSVPRWEYGDMVDLLQNPQSPNWMGLGAMASGGVVVGVLNFLQMNVAWWRLSPIGFLLQGGWGINALIWANAFVGWCLVSAIYRFGGLRLYQRLRPAFFGLFLGSTVATLLSSAIRLLVGTPGR